MTTAGNADSSNGSWKDALPEDIRGAKELEGIADLPSLAKAYCETTVKLAGIKDPVIPESADKYEIVVPKIEGTDKVPPEIEEAIKGIREYGHSLKLTNEQVQQMVDREVKEFTDSVKQAVEASEKLLSPLKKEWGDRYDERIAEANLALTKLAGSDADIIHRIVEETGLGAHPAFIKMFHRLLPLVSEAGALKGERHASSTTTVGANLENIIYPNLPHPT